MPEPSSAVSAGIVSPDRVRTVLQGLLRGAQLEGWTDAALEQASGVPARTIKSYRIEGKEPSLSNAMSLGVVLGERAINTLLAVIGYGGAKPLDEPDGIELPTLIATVLSNSATIASAAADGRIDHQERPSCREAADQIIAAVMPLSTAGEAE